MKVQITKIKMTSHRVKGDGCIWEGRSLMNVSCVSQSVSDQSTVLKKESSTGAFL